MNEGDRVHVSAVVMSHPRRRHLAEQLCRAHPELGLTIVSDPDPAGAPSAWRTARRAWSAVSPDATHHLVLQDDLVLASGFAETLTAAIESRPRDAISLFVEWGSRTASAIRVASVHGRSWAPVVDDYIPCAALVLPTQIARGFSRFAAETSSESDPDDVVLLDYLASVGVQPVALVANPVEHDLVESVVGNTIMGLRRSVNFVDRPAPPTDSIVDELDAVPYYDWWDQQAAMFVADDSASDGWRRLRSGPAVERWGLDPALVRAAVDHLLSTTPNMDQLLDRVNRIVVVELCIAGLLLGLVARDIGPVPLLTSGSPIERTLATLAPGALRRVVPEHWLPWISELAAPVIRRGFEAGVGFHPMQSNDNRIATPPPS